MSTTFDGNDQSDFRASLSIKDTSVFEDHRRVNPAPNLDIAEASQKADVRYAQDIVVGKSNITGEPSLKKLLAKETKGRPNAILGFLVATFATFAASLHEVLHNCKGIYGYTIKSHLPEKLSTARRSSSRSVLCRLLLWGFEQGWRTKLFRTACLWLNSRIPGYVDRSSTQHHNPIVDNAGDQTSCGKVDAVAAMKFKGKNFNEPRWYHSLANGFRAGIETAILHVYSYAALIKQVHCAFSWLAHRLLTTFEWCFGLDSHLIRLVSRSWGIRKLIVQPVGQGGNRIGLTRAFRPVLILSALTRSATATDPSETSDFMGVDRNIVSNAISYFGDLVGPAAVIATFLFGSAILFAIVFCTKSRRRTPRKIAFVAGVASVSWWLMEMVDHKDESQKVIIGWICALLWAVLLSLCAKSLEDCDRFLFETLCSGGLTVMGIIFFLVAVNILRQEALDHNAMRTALSFGLPPLNAWTWFQFRRHLLRESRKSEVVELVVTDQNNVYASSSALEAQEIHVRGALPIQTAVQRPPLAITHA